MTGTWRLLEYKALWKEIATELWMIDKLLGDFGFWDLGVDLEPSHAQRMSRQLLDHVTKEAFNTVRYLTPWIFVAIYKILDVIHESTNKGLPVTFQKYPVLLEVCETLRESFRRARNKIVHTGKYAVSALPYKERGKTLYDNFLVVSDENHRRVIRISLYDVTFAAIFVSCLVQAIRYRRTRGSDLEGVYEQIGALRLGGWIEKELYLKVESSCKGLKPSSI